MNKIKYLQGIINDSSLTFINKLDKVRSNRMDFSMLLLLLDEKDLFTQNFPLDEIKNDKNILDFYRDPDTDKMLFSCCIDSDEFLLNILEDYEFSKQINDITDNGILKRLNSLYINVEFIQGLLDRNILKRYIEFGAASNVVFNQDLGVDYNIKLIDFMKENESFYTFEYLNGFDIDKDLKPYIYKFLKSKIDRSNIILFIDEYCDKNTVLDFLKFIDLDTLLFVIVYSFERETKLLDYDDIKADADLNLKLSNIELVSAYIINMIESDECRGLRMIHSLSECLNIEQLSTIIGKIFQVKGVAFILDLQETANENQLVINGFMNDEILNAIFCEKIKSGRYDLLEDLDLLPTMELNEKQLEDALFVFFTSSGHGEHFYDYEILDKVSNYVEVKENLANRIFQCGQKDLDLFVKLGLSSQWIAKQFGVDLFIKEMLENKEFDRLPDLISDNKVKIKEIMLQVIKNEHWHLDEYLKFSLSHELLESKEILKLVKKTDKSEIIEFLPANIINLLLKEKSVNSGLIVSPHLTS